MHVSTGLAKHPTHNMIVFNQFSVVQESDSAANLSTSEDESRQPDKPLGNYRVTSVSSNFIPPLQFCLPQDNKDIFHKWPSLPVLPTELEKFREKFTILLDLLQNRDGEKAKKLYTVLTSLAYREKAVEVVQYLDTLFFISELNAENTEILSHLPANNRKAHVEWLISLAEILTTGTDILTPSVEMALYCYRVASDAGSVCAKLKLIKCLLFEIGPLAYFAPDEALTYVSSMGVVDEPPVPEQCGEIEGLIFELVKLSDKPDTESRKKLAERLVNHPDSSFRNCGAMLFVEPMFGSVEPDTALSMLENNTNISDSEQFVAHYWIAKSWLIKANPKFGDLSPAERRVLIEKAEKALRKLSAENHLASMTLLARHYSLQKNDYQCLKCATDNHRQIDKLIRRAPDLALTLFQCIDQSKRPRLQTLASETELADNAQMFLSTALRHCHSQARLISLLECTVPCTVMSNLQKAGTSSVQTLPVAVESLLYDYRFTADPKVFPFYYVSHQIVHGHGGAYALQFALDSDPVNTCCTLICLEVGTSRMTRSELIIELLRLVPDFYSLPPVWQTPRYCKMLLFAIAYYLEDLLEHEGFMPFFTEMYYYCNPELKRDDTGVPDQYKVTYGCYLLQQGDPVGAERYFKMAAHAHPKKKMVFVCNNFQVARKNKKPLIRALGIFDSVTKLPAETRGLYSRLISCSDKLDADPAELLTWCNYSICFIKNSPHHLTSEEAMTLIKRSDALLMDSMFLITRMLRICWESLLGAAEQLGNAVAGKTVEFLRHELQVSQRTELKRVVYSNATVRDKSIAEDARFPNDQDLGCEHHLIAELLREESPSRRIELLTKCLKCKRWDVYTAIVFGLKNIETLSADHHSAAVKCIEKLARLLKNLMPTLMKVDEHVVAYQIVSLHCLIEKSNHCDDLEELSGMLEYKQTLLDARSSKAITELYKECPVSAERCLYQEAELTSRTFAEQCRAVCETTLSPDYMNYFLDYVRSRKNLGSDIDCLQQLAERSCVTKRAKLVIFIDSLTGVSCREEIVEWACNSKISLMDRVDLIMIGLEMQQIGLSDVERVTRHFPKQSAESVLLKALSADTCESLKTGLVDLQLRIRQEDSKIARLLSLLRPALMRKGLIREAYQSVLEYEDQYVLAMLEWHYRCGDGSQKVIDRLLASAGGGNHSAQCRLVDWILENNEQSEVLRNRCFRYINLPVLLCSPERLFYQGVVRLMGIGCQSSLKGIEIMESAFNSNSPVPSMRFLIMMEYSRVTTKLMETSQWDQFVEKFLACGVSWRDGWLLDFGIKNLEWLVSGLKKRMGSGASEPKLGGRVVEEIESWYRPRRDRIASPPAQQVVKNVGREKKKNAVTPSEAVSESSPGPELSLLEELGAILSMELRQILKDDGVDSVVELLDKLDRMKEPCLFQQLSTEQIVRGLECVLHTGKTPAVASRLLTVIMERDPTAADALREEVTASLEARHELKDSSMFGREGGFDEDLEMDLVFFPNPILEGSRHGRLVDCLIEIYLPRLPKPLVELICQSKHRFLLRGLLQSMQLWLIRFGDCTPTGEHRDIFEQYYRLKFLDYDLATESVADISLEKLYREPFVEPPRLGAVDFIRSVLDRPHLSVVERVRLFLKQPVELQKNILQHGLHTALCNGIYEMARSPRVRFKQQFLTKLVAEFVESEDRKLKIQGGLELCLAVKEMAPKHHSEVVERLLKLCDQLLQKPLSSWDGNKDRLWAMAAQRLACMDDL